VSIVYVAALSEQRKTQRVAKDSEQLRALMQAMSLGFVSGPDQYPLGSWLDKNNNTVPQVGRQKDTTATIFSIMIYNGSIPPECLVSPSETNPVIKVATNYAFKDPPTAVTPDLAIWDPAFSADFSGGRTGNVSYAHMQPAGKRLNKWTNSWSATEPILANRAPEIQSTSAGDTKQSVRIKLANPKSNTLRIHGNGSAWSGHVVFNDTHIEWCPDRLGPGTELTPEESTPYKAADGSEHVDVWCYDEPDDAEAFNNFVGIFVTAGETPADFKAIWD
jgi:hypothetical protein